MLWWLGKLVLGLLIGVAVSLFVGDSLTRAFVSDGLDRFSGEEHTAAEQALQRGRSGCADEPGDASLRRKFQVIEVTPTTDGRGTEGVPAYRVVLQAYTIYLRPIDKAIVSSSRGEVRCGIEGEID